MYIIDELKELFHENKQVYKKLVIIEHYLSDSIDKYKKSISSTYHLKPSRIEKIITSFEEDTGHAGYIQPIGKAYFLQTFLKKYPRHVSYNLVKKNGLYQDCLNIYE